ncbi:uncharacterized protein LOC126747945 [Anthonomus grandis grandis]|uniref:uncharacterized protein LOC126747945 n=1 Tax=Anthonomus grandis grandis TaxID=2921223 RepID=UPI002165551F|nr:uncharacterized protein LOC126747945 [Anthonomus grandis grandis]
MFYGVVEFQAVSGSFKKELSVVPLTWLIKNESKCYWPLGTHNIPMNEFIKNCPPPKKNWPRYKVLKVHFKTADFELADKQVETIIKEYEQNENFSSVSKKSVSELSESSSDTDEENEPLKKRQKILEKEHRNKKTGNIVLSSINQNQSLLPDYQTNVLVTPSSSSTSTMTLYDEAFNNDIIIDHDSALDETAIMVETIQSNLNNSDSVGRASYSVIGHGSGMKQNARDITTLQTLNQNSVDFQHTVLTSLASIQTTNEQILLTMQEILRFNKKIALEKLIAPENLPSFPLKSMDEFSGFENLIKEDSTVKQYMVRRLAALGGSGVEAVTRRIMKFLLTNEVGNQFNWKGRHNKVSFETTASMAIVYGKILKQFAKS